jgi:hypothetical protein
MGYCTLISKPHNIICAIELSVKKNKHSTGTLSFVIQRVRFKKNPQEITLAFKGG